MKDAVDKKQGNFFLHAPFPRLRLTERGVQRNRDIAQVNRFSCLLRLFLRPRKNVGRRINPTPLPVQFLYTCIIGQQDAYFRPFNAFLGEEFSRRLLRAFPGGQLAAQARFLLNVYLDQAASFPGWWQ